ncbi:MAG: glycosyltransferase family 39 protein [candidate division WOR-3 bacterium]
MTQTSIAYELVKDRRRDTTIVLLLFALAASLRLFRLNYWDPLPDEISYALTASRLVTGRTLFSTDITFFPPLFVYLAALLQTLGIEMLLSVRLVSALFGSLLIPLIYLILRVTNARLDSFTVTTSAAFLFVPALYSRLGQVEVPLLFFLLLSALLLISGVIRERRHLFFLSGISLGLALWIKEIALGGLASNLLFLLLLRPIRWRWIITLCIGWLTAATPLFVLGAITGNNLLFEISPARGFDINMESLSLPASVVTIAANTVLNLFARVFSDGELLMFAAAGSTFTLTALWTVIQHFSKGDALARYLLCYAIVHIPFFVIFSRKFFYYLLPAALLLFITAAVCSLRELRRHRRGLGLVTLLLAGLTVAFNIYSSYYLYFNRGNHQTFAKSLTRIPSGDTLLTSHPDLLKYLVHRYRFNLTVLPLFSPGSYEIDSIRCTDPTVSAVILKASYYERLTARSPATWVWLRQVYPYSHTEIDPDWSLIPDKHCPRGLGRLAARLTRPIGTVILTRQP